MSAKLSVPCHAASTPSLDDGQDAVAVLPEISTLGPTAQPYLVGCQARIAELASMRTSPHPTTLPRVNKKNQVQFYGVTAALMPSHMPEGDVSLVCVPARMISTRLRLWM